MKILAVCLGNICRSPLAEGILRYFCQQQNLEWEIDSAGTSDWHVNENPCEGSIKIARKNGINISHLKGRQVTQNDFDYYDLILAMDSSNFQELRRLAINNRQKEKIELILNYSFPGENRSVPDSYYTENYSEVFDLLHAACSKIVDKFSP
jgi:protein-tyrosine phosphatase